jgi:hypothetical protein
MWRVVSTQAIHQSCVESVKVQLLEV